MQHRGKFCGYIAKVLDFQIAYVSQIDTVYILSFVQIVMLVFDQQTVICSCQVAKSKYSFKNKNVAQRTSPFLCEKRNVTNSNTKFQVIRAPQAKSDYNQKSDSF